MDETFFLGGIEKAPVLEALRPHIFFDDQLRHLRSAQERVPSAHVVSEREQLPMFADEALAAAAAAQEPLILPPVERARRSTDDEVDRPAREPATEPLELTPADDRG
jgi:hypothetical protein